ncbi:MAG: hypothetical protein WA055_05285 [Candidatus Moraniibacteriota bacterium]
MDQKTREICIGYIWKLNDILNSQRATELLSKKIRKPWKKSIAIKILSDWKVLFTEREKNISTLTSIRDTSDYFLAEIILLSLEELRFLGMKDYPIPKYIKEELEECISPQF